MTYIQKISPWCIVRIHPTMQHQIVARVRSRSNAEAHLQAVQRLEPNATFTLIFYPVVE